MKIVTWLEKNKVTRAPFKLLMRTFEHDVYAIAGEIAFFLMLAVFPMILYLTSILTQLQLNNEQELLQYLLPESILTALEGSVHTAPQVGIITILVAIFSASNGVWMLTKGISIAYTDEKLKRPFLQRVVALVFMVGFAAAVVLSLLLLVFGRMFFDQLSKYIGSVNIFFVEVFRQGVVLLLVFVFVLALYRCTPGFKQGMRKMIPGAAVVAVGWVLVTYVYEIYMTSFGGTNTFYGSVGAFMGMMIWLYIITILILIGAELNAMMAERPKRR